MKLKSLADKQFVAGLYCRTKATNQDGELFVFIRKYRLRSCPGNIIPNDYPTYHLLLEKYIKLDTGRWTSRRILKKKLVISSIGQEIDRKLW